MASIREGKAVDAIKYPIREWVIVGMFQGSCQGHKFAENIREVFQGNYCSE